ncbi:DUF2267 domain-containing protein [Fulvivirgaceae bacterium PWU4]|uniref:DUF2267 domain-containing protein n=1 Tax=Chryseosolibacter histidini TaxID=2782349 RepID=A0AAP2DLY2_9BACT|nr:DUF2267 domain-containing protein [Chryseosolibacter histidini]MBT1698791.1 DUF2267 domain-containing protein [Chryseosolibacter histidini]
MVLNFDEYRHKGIKFYKRVARELQTGDLGYADRLVTTLLNVLRERISLEESLEIISFLPMHVKGVYAHGWKLSSLPQRLFNEEDLLTAVRMKYPHTGAQLPADDATLRNNLRSVFRVFHQEAANKGMDLRQKLPPAVQGLCPVPEEAESKKAMVKEEGEMQHPESVS